MNKGILESAAVALLSVATLSLGCAGPARANQVRGQNTSRQRLTLPGAIKTVTPSVVQIEYYFELAAGGVHMGPLGTGFIVTTQGHVVTAKHVADALEASKPRDAAGNLLPVSHQFLGVGLPGPNTPNARANFLLVPAELVDVDALHDVALLKITVGGTLVPTKLSPSRPEEGQPIAVSGYPLSNVVLVTTSGAVASSWSYGLDPTSTGLTISDWYTSDMRVNPGNSGGPVYSVATGAVIGVCVLSEQAPVQYSDGAKEPVKIEGRFLAYNSGLSIFVPIKYAIELLRKKNIKWSEAGAH